MEKPFKYPHEMRKRDQRTPISSRVKTSTKEALEAAAKANKLSLGEIISNVLDDYAQWLEQAGKQKKGS